MRNIKKLKLGKTKIISLNFTNKVFGGEPVEAASAKGDFCKPEITQTKTNTKDINLCDSNLLCPSTD
ncbi:hypothetical protein [Kordia sp.]|uniref:hypothetical protein n=1 Tax=Kordia sp. TaxID=1965332 RepID=UPI003B5C1F1B